MLTERGILVVGLAACLALPAMAQAPTPLDDKNTKITNTIGASGDGQNNNGKGNASFASGVWEINGGGDDIWSSADGMTFVSTALDGDGNITARILDEKGGSGDGWARDGIMIRESDQGEAKNAGLFFANEDSSTPRGRQLHAHWRFDTGGDQVWDGDTGPYSQDGRYPSDGDIGMRYFPLWMRVQRQGNIITTFRSDDGKLWEQCTRPQALDLPATARAGIFASSHGGTNLETSHFDNVSVGKQVLKPGPTSAQAVAGDGMVLVTWTGAPGADQYNVYRRIDGEKEFTKLTAQPTKQTFFTDATVPNGKIARYLVTGLAGSDETAASLQQPASPSAPIAIGKGSFFSQDIDTKLVGTTQTAGGQLTITAAGAGIANRWGNGDAFRFVAAQMDGNVTLTAQVMDKPTSNQDRNADDGGHQAGGVGLMIREGLAPNARFGLIVTTLGTGVHFRGRAEANMNADVSEDGTDNDTTKYPLFLRIQRVGDAIKGFQSADGKTFTQVGGDLSLSGLKAPVYVGIAVSNGFEGFTTTAQLDAKSLTLE